MNNIKKRIIGFVSKFVCLLWCHCHFSKRLGRDRSKAWRATAAVSRHTILGQYKITLLVAPAGRPGLSASGSALGRSPGCWRVAAGDHDVNSAGKPSPDSHSALFGRPGILEVTVMIMIVTRSPSVAAVDSEERRGPRNGCPRKICTHVCLNTSLIPSVKFKFLVCFLSSNFETV